MPPSEPPPLFATAFAALGLSLLLALLSAEGGADSAAGAVAVAWLQSVAHAVGLVCLAGHVLWRVLDHVAAPSRAPEGEGALSPET